MQEQFKKRFGKGTNPRGLFISLHGRWQIGWPWCKVDDI
jgi:hypothetical protein